MRKESFIVHSDDAECVDALSDEGAGRLFKALLNYSKSGKQPELSGAELMAFMFMKKQLDRDSEKYREICEKRRVAGALGGRPKKEEEKAKAFENMQEEAKEPDTDSVSETEKDTENCFTKREKEKKAYGFYKNVFLKDCELEALALEFPNDHKKRIERLSEYMEQTGKAYKSHFATLRAWANKEAEKAEKQSAGTAFSDNSYDSGKLELLSRSSKQA